MIKKDETVIEFYVKKSQKDIMNILNNKGLTIVESLIAVMLTGVAIVGLLTMQPLGWKSAGKANSLTLATELMQRELETAECSIMSGTIPANKVNVSQTIGRETFTINTTTTVRDTVTWLVRVRINWQGNAKGVSSSLIVSRQTAFD
jgi:Tfp pilus assembly protein PilV